jgi:hypothetical protein
MRTTWVFCAPTMRRSAYASSSGGAPSPGGVREFGGGAYTRCGGAIRAGFWDDFIVLCSPAGCVVAPQAIAVLRNVARETSQRKIGHKIRKVIRQEAAKWAGLGTPESDARIAEMERQIAERGGVCVVKSDEEIARLMAEREREEAVA